MAAKPRTKVGAVEDLLKAHSPDARKRILSAPQRSGLPADIPI